MNSLHTRRKTSQDDQIIFAGKKNNLTWKAIAAQLGRSDTAAQIAAYWHNTLSRRLTPVQTAELPAKRKSEDLSEAREARKAASQAVHARLKSNYLIDSPHRS